MAAIWSAGFDWNVDLSIGKKTHITERAARCFTFDMINALITWSLSPYIVIAEQTSFGVINTRTERLVLFSSGYV